jgi:hypothetical protein
MNKATWKKGKKRIKGVWEYYWPGDYFNITLFKKDNITGETEKTFRCDNDTPEWGNWKLVR